jgi:hypothetical protein
MRWLDVVEVFDRETAEFVFAATFQFDPLFFERRLLTTRAVADARRIVIFVDAAQWAQLANEERMAQHINRRYLLIPVRRSHGVFHPKLYLLLGKTSVTLMVGSANLTSHGLTHNLELCNVVNFRSPQSAAEIPEPVVSLVRSMFSMLGTWCASTAAPVRRIGDDFLREAGEFFPWISGDQTVLTQRAATPMLIHSTTQGLLGQAETLLRDVPIKRIHVLSPCFDNDAELFRIFREHWRAAEMHIVTRSGYANLPIADLKRLARSGQRRDLQFFDLRGKRHRRLHAKAIAFEADQATYWLVGSANFTQAAFDGRNVETALWFRTEKDPDDLLYSGDLTKAPISLKDFEPGPEMPPEGEPRTRPDLVLNGGVLHQDQTLELDYSLPESSPITEFQIRIRNVGEDMPCVALKCDLPHSGGLRIALSDKQVRSIQRGALCQIAGGVGRRKVLSNPVWLVQLSELNKETLGRGGSHVRLQRIVETGEGLIEQLREMAALGQWTEISEFLDVVTIAFDDGELAWRGLGRAAGYSRDPFTGDDPVQWLGLPDGSMLGRLQESIANFVVRHQKRLRRHVDRGNLNGLANFLNIFRTLNQITVECFSRKLISYSDAIEWLCENLLLFSGRHGSGDQERDRDGYVDTLLENLEGEAQLVRERFLNAGAAPVIVAALEQAQRIRTSLPYLGNRRQLLSGYSRNVQTAFEKLGIRWPDTSAVRAAEQDYRGMQLA